MQRCVHIHALRIFMICRPFERRMVTATGAEGKSDQARYGHGAGNLLRDRERERDERGVGIYTVSPLVRYRWYSIVVLGGIFVIIPFGQ